MSIKFYGTEHLALLLVLGLACAIGNVHEQRLQCVQLPGGTPLCAQDPVATSSAWGLTWLFHLPAISVQVFCCEIAG